MLRIPYRDATSTASRPGGEAFELAVDLDHRLVQEGGGADEELDRIHPRQLRAGPRDRPGPGRHLPGQAALEAQEPAQVRGQ
jgi:hypothetical protein